MMVDYKFKIIKDDGASTTVNVVFYNGDYKTAVIDGVAQTIYVRTDVIKSQNFNLVGSVPVNQIPSVINPTLKSLGTPIPEQL